jgi:hypothetical protein
VSRPLCAATTRRGAPCRNRALDGSDRCRAHAAPRPDAETVTTLVSMLRAGNYLEIAARAAGVPLDELLEHPDLREEIETARAEGEARGVARVAAAAAENWQAAAWLLERQHPGRWGRPALRLDDRPAAPVSGADGLDELAGKRQARRAGLA